MVHLVLVNRTELLDRSPIIGVDLGRLIAERLLLCDPGDRLEIRLDFAGEETSSAVPITAFTRREEPTS